MSPMNPFDQCPVYETSNFIFELVKEEDAQDLLACYTDPMTKKRMNNDNCGGEWNICNIDAIYGGIRAWRHEFEVRFFIRWSIYYKQANKVVGTIEIAPIPNTTRFWDGICPTGILRIDICSHLENEMVLSEIIKMVSDHFFADFDIGNIIMKATKEDGERISALRNNHFDAFTDDTFPYRDYYIKRK